MKRIMRLCFLTVCMAVFFYGCAPTTNEPSYAEQILSGTHELRKMAEQQGSTTTTSGGFFLFVGGFNQTQTTETLVKFAWKMNDGTFAISSIPMEKIRVSIDESVTTPTVRFKWRSSNSSCFCGGNRRPELQTIISSNVIYMLLRVRSADWPAQVQLPMNTEAPSAAVKP